MLPKKPGTEFGGNKNGTRYKYTITKEDGTVVVPETTSYNSQISWTPTVGGKYKIRVTFWRNLDDNGTNLRQWFISQSDPEMDVLEADLLVLEAFGIAGPIGTEGKTALYNYYHDTMPYLRITCDGVDLVPGEVYIEATIYKGGKSNNVIIAREFITSNDQLANGWTLNETTSNWDWSKVDPTTYITAYLRLIQLVPDGSGGLAENELAKSSDFYAFLKTGGPTAMWYMGGTNQYQPKSFYTPGATPPDGETRALGVTLTAIAADYPFGAGHGALRVLYSLKDLKTGNYVVSPTMLAQTNQTFIIQNLPDAIFATAGGHYEARFHFYRIHDGGPDKGGCLVEFDEQYDLVNEFYVMNAPPPIPRLTLTPIRRIITITTGTVLPNSPYSTASPYSALSPIIPRFLWAPGRGSTA